MTHRGTFAFIAIPLPEKEPSPHEMMNYFFRLNPDQMRIAPEAEGTPLVRPVPSPLKD